jgi:DNA polymerase I
MPFKIDFRDGEAHVWSITPAGATVAVDDDYAPTVYVASDGRDLAEARDHLRRRGDVVATGVVERRTTWRDDPERVLRLDLRDIDAVDVVASEVRGWGDPGDYTLYNVDFSRQFRYCLETGTDPVPPDGVAPTVCELALPPKARSDGDVTELAVDGEPAGDAPREVVEAVAARLAECDPDVLVLSSAELVPLLSRVALEAGVDEFRLGRRPGWEQLARESTFESYGRVGHSPARYDVPGRAIIDTSNSFFWGQTNLDGLFDLVERSRKPLQETAWASIGNVFTAIQIREALDSGTLVPWRSWRHEQFKPMSTLHESDRGGYIFSPDVGFHEDVHELDFSSLYPNIMVTRNVSPDTIRCDCHADRADVPGLGYSVCDDEGYLGRVLEPLIEDREEYKAAIEETDDEERAAALRGRASALKWILVSCFGYQGFSNAKFGRIECHEAINAFAREILLDAKELLEQHGWRVLHGIVDSLWVQRMPDADPTPLDDLVPVISGRIEIPLEHEARYDWIAFAPRRESSEGALNRYVAKAAGADAFKRRGIELRQRSTPPFVEDCQEELLRALDEHREPAPVCDRLRRQLRRLEAGAVDPQALVVRQRVSKEREAYTQATRNVAALDRAARHDFDVSPGEDVEYVVVDDDKASSARVALAFEEPDRYDADFYADLLVRAAESVVSPLGWDRARIRRYLSETEETRITAY